MTRGCFDPDVTYDMLIVYDKEYLREQIKKLEDPHHKITGFPAICADGSFRPLSVPIDVWDPHSKRYVTEEKRTILARILLYSFRYICRRYNKEICKDYKIPDRLYFINSVFTSSTSNTISNVFKEM